LNNNNRSPSFLLIVDQDEDLVDRKLREVILLSMMRHLKKLHEAFNVKGGDRRDPAE
jgi:hypothetical protein